jgi:short-subunit dehydrogenase
MSFVAVITGASSGIGAAAARRLAREPGAGLVLVARREERLRELADELSTVHHGLRVEVVVADLIDEAARRTIVDEVAARGLELAALVNAAGLSTVGPVHRNDPAAELTMLRTNVEALAHLTSLVLPGMVERRQGGILNVASTAAFQPLPGQAGYAASKAFVVSYSRAVREEVRGHGVTVTVLCPGPVRTEFAETAGFDPSEADSALPSFMWVEASEVARAAVDGLEHGRAHVIPGAANRAAAYMAPLVPPTLLTKVLARQHPGLQGS